MVGFLSKSGNHNKAPPSIIATVMIGEYNTIWRILSYSASFDRTRVGLMFALLLISQLV